MTQQMSELNSGKIKITNDGNIIMQFSNYHHVIDSDTELYYKHQADKVIAEKDKKIADAVKIMKEQEHEIAEKDKEIAELKEERRWRKCSEELPTAKDANESGKLLGYLGGFKIAHEYHWTDVRDKLYGITHWMPLPKAPEEAK